MLREILSTVSSFYDLFRQILDTLKSIDSTLKDIRDELVPEPATTLNLTAGPVKEQP